MCAKHEPKWWKGYASKNKSNNYKASTDAQIDAYHVTANNPIGGEVSNKKDKKWTHIKTPKQLHFQTHNERVNLVKSREQKA